MFRTSAFSALALVFALGTAAPVFADSEMSNSASGDDSYDVANDDSDSSAVVSSSSPETCSDVSDDVTSRASRC